MLSHQLLNNIQVIKKHNYLTVGKWPICIGSKHFSVHEISKDDDGKTVKQFCKGKTLDIFLECTYFHKKDEVKDGYLWREVNN